VALAVAAVAWIVTGDAVRAVAVLVTATPCPLLLAVPIAVTAGMSRVSRLGVVVKHGGALEALGRARTAVLDKTGTVTMGEPRITDVLTAPGHTVDDVVSLAAAVEQLSPHVLAGAVLRFAGSDCAPADRVAEQWGGRDSGRVARRHGRTSRAGVADLTILAR
ncbi:heavy metal translocating P-type ATPase, partial [Kibdelosporangium lantanae]